MTKKSLPSRISPCAAFASPPNKYWLICIFTRYIASTVTLSVALNFSLKLKKLQTPLNTRFEAYFFTETRGIRSPLRSGRRKAKVHWTFCAPQERNAFHSFYAIISHLPHEKRSNLYCGRWGEVDTEKDSVNLFPTEPTDEGAMHRGDLGPWVQGTPRRINQKGLSLKA